MPWTIDETIARSACYKLLSLVFLSPGASRGECGMRNAEWGIHHSEFRTPNFEETCRGWPNKDPGEEAREVFSSVRRVIEALPEGHRALLAPIASGKEIPGEPSAAESHRLFGVGLAATPYESEYDPLALARKGHCLADLLGFYEAFGFRLAAERKEFPDHVAVELEFMSLLLLKAAHAGAEGKAEAQSITEQAAVKFLADHLAEWVGIFAGRVAATTSENFYQFWARLLKEFLIAECQFLGVTPVMKAAASLQEAEPPACPFANVCQEAPGEAL